MNIKKCTVLLKEWMAASILLIPLKERDQVYPITRVPTQLNTIQHEPNTNQYEPETSQRK